MNYYRLIDWQAIFLAFLGSHAIPIIFVCVLMKGLSWLVFLWFITPFLNGYLVAKLAKGLPLVHALTGSAISLIFWQLSASKINLWGVLFMALITIPFSIAGAMMWRRFDGKSF